MSFPRYPKYKPSGVEWLGDVPEGWLLNRLNHHFCERREKVSDRDFAALSVTKNGIVPQLDSAAKTDNGDNRKKVCIGDFVINSRSDRKGSSGVSPLEGSVSVITTVLRPEESVHGPFIHHMLRSYPFQEEFYRYGKGIVADLWSTHFSEMRNILLAIPPLPEQKAIAEFLDRETGKIDELVAEQRRLMELLKEKRQAVISHAVTKGLNPHAPMKPSGIEWLGDVPTGWEVVKLKRVTISRCDGPFGSGLKSEHYCDEGIRVIRLQNIRSGHFDDRDTAFISPEYYEELGDHSVKPGDLLIAGLGDENHSVGRACVAPSNIGPAMVKADCFRFRLNSKLASASYLALQLSTTANALAGALSTGTTRGRMNLSASEARELALPSIDEQNAIVAHIETELARFYTLTAEAQRAIDLLQERRTALISAAVTGQIDVRNHSPKH